MTRRTCWLLLGLLLLASVPALTPEDFARGVTLMPVGEGALQRLELPRDLYEIATMQLTDVRVFNAEGEMVPHMLLSPSNSSRVLPQQSIELPFFRVAAKAVAAHLGGEALRVRIEESPSGTSIDIASGEATRGAPWVYLIDARAAAAPLESLVFDWPEAVSFTAGLKLEASQDLSRWQTLSEMVVLMQVRRGGDKLKRDTIDLPSVTADFLRLTSTGGALPPPLTVTASLQLQRPAAEPVWMDAPLIQTSGGHLFDSGGVPVSRLRFDLIEENTLAQVTLHSALSPEHEIGHPRYQGLLYRLKLKGQTITTPEMVFTPTRDRYWRLQVDPAGGGLGRAEPRLKVGYLPHNLLFVARGSAPFTLAYGSALATEKDTTPLVSEQFLPAGFTVTDLPLITPSAPFELAGTEVLEPPAGLPWARVALWAVLIAGFFVLTAMALSLLRRLPAPSER